MRFSTYMVSRILLLCGVVCMSFTTFAFAQSSNGYAQLVYDPVTNAFTIVWLGGSSSSPLSWQVVSWNTLGSALIGWNALWSPSTSLSTGGSSSGASASSSFSVRNISLVYLQWYVDKLRQITESAFSTVDTKNASTYNQVYGGSGLHQQRELLSCLQLTTPDTPLFDQNEHYKKLKWLIAEKSSQVFASIIAQDQKLSLWTISSWSLDDILARKAIESEITLFQSSIPILVDAYSTNAVSLIKTEQAAFQDLLTKNKLNVDLYSKREAQYSLIESAYNKFFKQVGADQNIAWNIELFNMLADQSTSFYVEQYQKHLKDNFLGYVTVDSIWRNALEKETQKALEATKKKLDEFSRQQLNKSYPADTLQGILSAMTKLRAAYLVDWQKSCKALLQDNTMDTLAPTLQKQLDTMVNSSTDITSKVSSGTNRSQIRGSYMEAMQTFYDDIILWAFFDQQVFDLTKVVTTYGGVVTKASKPAVSKSAQALDLVKRVLVQKYLQYLAKWQADTFAQKIDRAMERLEKMKQNDNGSLASLLKLVDEGISYVKDEFLVQ